MSSPQLRKGCSLRNAREGLGPLDKKQVRGMDDGNMEAFQLGRSLLVGVLLHQQVLQHSTLPHKPEQVVVAAKEDVQAHLF